MIVARDFGWTTVAIVGTSSIAWMAACLVVSGTVLVFVAGIIVPICGIASGLMGRR